MATLQLPTLVRSPLVMGVAKVLPFAVRETTQTTPPKPRLLDRVREAIRARHSSRRTEKTYVAWIRRHIFFHGKRHHAEMGAAEITQFLTSLAVDGKVAASTQNQALSALLFLYREVLEQDLPWLDGVVRAKLPQRLPMVLTRDEVRAVLQELDGVPRLMAVLLYGAGLRLLECARLRVKDVDFTVSQIVVRGGKGDKDRLTMLPAAVKDDLARHLKGVRELHQADLQRGAGWVELPDALMRKYPQAGREWAWQWVLPATRIYVDRLTGQRRRHHLQELLGHHAVSNRGPAAVRSPADRMSGPGAVPRHAASRTVIGCNAVSSRSGNGRGARALRPRTRSGSSTTSPSAASGPPSTSRRPASPRRCRQFSAGPRSAACSRRRRIRATACCWPRPMRPGCGSAR